MMAPPPAVVAVSVRFHHWRLGFRQSSFHHIARVLQGATLHAFRWPLLLRHALVPSGFRLQVNRMTQKSPFELLLTASGIQHRVPRRTTFTAHGSPPYIVGTISPFPRCVRVSPFLMVYASLPTRFFLVAHAITTCTLGTTGTPLPYRFPCYRDSSSRQSHVSSEEKVQCI